ncbi:hypothetical protein YB2330_005187 [Saitoella coloradoensis]
MFSFFSGGNKSPEQPSSFARSSIEKRDPDAPPAYDAPVGEQYPPLDTSLYRHLRGKRIILASASPRRRALLAQMGLEDVEVVPSGFEENVDKSLLTPWEYVLETARQKALMVYERIVAEGEEPDLVLGFDTIISVGNTVIEKPPSTAAHLTLLKQLRDSPTPHKVFTACIAIAPLTTPRHPGYCLRSHVEETSVKFSQSTTDEWIEAYVRSGEGRDKAGGYAIQGRGAVLVERVEGDYGNVVGVPMRGTYQLIERVLFEQGEDEVDGEEEQE